MSVPPILLLILALGSVLFGVLLFGAYRMAPDPRKTAAARLNKVKDRFSNSRDAAAKAQMRRILAMQHETPLDQMIRNLIPRPAELRARLARTGRDITLGRYGLYCGALMIGVMVLCLLFGLPLFLSFLTGVLIGLGLPHIAVGFLVSRRINAFITSFPEAIDLLVRSLRSGLPVTEALAIAGREIPDPVGIEFRTVADKIRIGRTLEQALGDTAKRIPTPEFQFFVITLAIQRETGGNLAETLNNLSDVLRKRQQMKLKIKAMSSEAKASAYILGSLPFIVFGLIYLVNSQYLSGFFSDIRLMITAGIGIIWMSIGCFIMYKMVNFKI